jgi:hypothetical protein
VGVSPGVAVSYSQTACIATVLRSSKKTRHAAIVIPSARARSTSVANAVDVADAPMLASASSAVCTARCRLEKRG